MYTESPISQKHIGWPFNSGHLAKEHQICILQHASIPSPLNSQYRDNSNGGGI